MTGVLAAYRGPEGDEAVEASGRVRPAYAGVAALLDRLGDGGLAAAGAAVAAAQRERGVVVGSWIDGRPHVQPLAQDPVPRAIAAADWAVLARGIEQRHRVFDAFLADAYRAAGRRRGDADRAPEVVRAGVVPEWAVARSPSHDPEAVGLAWPGQRRVAVAGADVVRTADGGWLVVEDHLQVPAGIGYAVAARTGAAALLAQLPAPGPRPLDARAALPLLRDALAAVAPPACSGPPACAILSAGESDGAWFEHRLLAEELGLPMVRATDLRPRPDGGIEAIVDGGRLAIDVLYRRFPDGELAAHRAGSGQPLLGLLAEAVRAGRLGIANVPGNGLADDRALYALVPAMIRFYLGEEPILRSARAWTLADPAQWAEVRDRLHELVLAPVGGYGGGGAIAGSACSPAELARLRAEVAAAPHRFVAREPVVPSTAPTLVGGRLEPRHVDLRLFSVATAAGTCALPAPWTRVAGGAGVAGLASTDPAGGAGSKDTWLLP